MREYRQAIEHLQNEIKTLKKCESLFDKGAFATLRAYGIIFDILITNGTIHRDDKSITIDNIDNRDFNIIAGLFDERL